VGPDDDPETQADDRPSPGASDPGEPGYDGEVTVGDDGFEVESDEPDPHPAGDAG
jgi:hypothetical protein